MTQDQLNLLSAGPELPEGFKYQPDMISADDEQRLMERVRELPLTEFVFHGVTAKRRVVSSDWQYDFDQGALRKTDDILPCLLSPGKFLGV